MCVGVREREREKKKKKWPEERERERERRESQLSCSFSPTLSPSLLSPLPGVFWLFGGNGWSNATAAAGYPVSWISDLWFKFSTTVIF